MLFTSCSSDDDEHEIDYSVILGTWYETSNIEGGEYVSGELELSWTFRENKTATQRLVMYVNGVNMKDASTDFTYIYNASKLTNLVDRDEKVRNIITTPGGNQEVWLLTEDGLYEALFQSRKPIAKEFKKGVKEILKTIRKTGGYIATKQDDTPEEIMARALIVAQETIKRKEERLKQLEEKNAKLQPKADFAEAAFKAEGKVDIGQAAKILNLGFGRNTLFGKLRDAGIFFKDRNEPKQKYIDAGYFEMTLLPPIRRDNHPDILCQKVFCKPKGLAYINHLFGGKPSDGKIAKIK